MVQKVQKVQRVVVSPYRAMSFVCRSAEWKTVQPRLTVSRLKGRPFYVQAMGQLRLTCTFSAECAQPEGCGIALSGDEYICRLRRSYTILRAKRASLRKEAINCGEAATTTLAPSGASNLRTLSGEAAVNPKNLFTQSFYTTFLHNPRRSRAPFSRKLTPQESIPNNNT